ncbi:MAG: DUF4350 domain-containing protein, partial [Chloroflexota bacterium]
MMKKDMLWLAVAAFVLPILARVIWFYPGVPTRPEIATPDYKSMVIPTPPVETPVALEEVNNWGGIAVIDYAHNNQFQMGEIQTLKEEIERRGGSLEFSMDASLLQENLKYASAYVVISPSVGFSTSEMHDIQAFVERGGRVVVFTDATRGVMYYD